MYYENINSDFDAFLTHLDTIFLAQSWTIEATSTTLRVYSGNGVFVGFELNNSIIDAFKNSNSKKLNINVFSSYDSLNGFYEQTGGILSPPREPGVIYQTDAKAKTFISLNDSRIIFVMLQKGYYQSFYLGKFLQYAAPASYTEPFVCLSSAIDSEVLSLDYSPNRTNWGSITSKSNVGSFVKNFNGDWIRLFNAIRLGEISKRRLGEATTYPFFSRDQENWGKNIDGSYTALPSVIISDLDITGGYFLGELEGLFGVSGFENSPENTFTFDSEEYICFPATYQSFLCGDYFCIKKDGV